MSSPSSFLTDSQSLALPFFVFTKELTPFLNKAKSQFLSRRKVKKSKPSQNPNFLPKSTILTVDIINHKQIKTMGFIEVLADVVEVFWMEKRVGVNLVPDQTCLGWVGVEIN